MTPQPPSSLLQAAIEFLPAQAAELEFLIDAAITSGDVQALWVPGIVNGLAAIKTADSLSYGRLRNAIRVKFKSDISPALYDQAIKDAQRSMRLEIPRAAQILPDVQTNNRPMRDQSLDILRSLRLVNDPPKLFARGGTICEIRIDEKSKPEIVALNAAQFRGHMDRSCNYVSRSDGGTKVGHPPRDIVDDIMGLSPIEWGFPALEAIVEVPTLRPDGTILDKPGYDKQSGMYYAPADGFSMPPIPDQLGADDIDAAVAMVEEAFCDFPMANRASRANYFALMLTPVIRPAVRGCVPLALIDAPQMGTGKTLLANVFSIITTGRPAPMAAYPKEDTEMEKKVGASLMAGRQIVCFDNLEGPLLSPVLALALTARDFETRVLGQSKMVTVANRCTWLITGNNIRPDADMPRRCYQIRIDARSSQPFVNRSFRHPNLEQWVMDNRGELLRSLLIMARAWFLAGRPPVGGTSLGSFEEWHAIIGGILRHARIEGFLENFAELVTGNDQAVQWERLLDDIGDVWTAGQWFTVRNVTAVVRQAGQTSINLPDSMVDVDLRKDGLLERNMGRWFGKKLRQRLGEPGLYLQKYIDRHSNICWWRVMSGKLDEDPVAVAKLPVG